MPELHRAARAVALLLVAGGCAGEPTGIEPRDLPRRTVAAGTDHSCALDDEGRAYCWGSNRLGQLGAPSVEGASWTPVAAATQRRFVSIAAATPNELLGPFATCGLTADGEAYCWGRNSFGVISEGSEESCAGVMGDTHYSFPCVRTPTRVAPNLRFDQISLGGGFICGVTAEGEGWCWGRGDRGRLGNGALESSPSPSRVAGGHRLATIAAGDAHACALDADGAVWCWGDDAEGQLGGGTTGTMSTEPVLVDWPVAFRSIDAGDVHTCAVDAEWRVVCWGAAASGRLGRFPTAVEPPRGPLALQEELDLVAVSAGLANGCATARTGGTLCWGQLSDGESAAQPVPVGGPAFAEVSAGFVHACARAEGEGDVWCWGDNEFPGPGQLGAGDDVSFSSIPLRVVF